MPKSARAAWSDGSADGNASLSEPEGDVVAHLGYLAADGECRYRARFGLAEPDRCEAGRRHPRGVRKRTGKAILQAGHWGAQPGDESLEQAVTVRLAGQDRRDSHFEWVPRPWYGQARALGHQG